MSLTIKPQGTALPIQSTSDTSFFGKSLSLASKILSIRNISLAFKFKPVVQVNGRTGYLAGPDRPMKGEDIGTRQTQGRTNEKERMSYVEPSWGRMPAAEDTYQGEATVSQPESLVTQGNVLSEMAINSADGASSLLSKQHGRPIHSLTRFQSVEEIFDPQLSERLNHYKDVYAERFKVMDRLSYLEPENPKYGDIMTVMGLTDCKFDSSHFINNYKKNEWIIKDVFEDNEAVNESPREYFASDVIIEQYEKVASHLGFYGSIPRTIIIQNISSPETVKYINGIQASTTDSNSEILDGFMRETPHGKFITHVLDAFGMKANSISFGEEKVVTSDTRNAVVNVSREFKMNNTYTNSPSQTNITGHSESKGRAIVQTEISKDMGQETPIHEGEQPENLSWIRKKTIEGYEEIETTNVVEDLYEKLGQQYSLSNLLDISPQINNNEMWELRFSLDNNTENKYIAINIGNSSRTIPDGDYEFVIRDDEPGIVRIKQWGGDGGHTSLSQEIINGETIAHDVRFAGTIGFDEGKITYWSNVSGHYRPDADDYLNMIPYVKRYFPDELYMKF
ncbi:hypothetical protein [Citrobacter portucalensis]|uniref:hypothetical protein n=1 Tax=Citrobacter portucalensis TaxID=1639133 RepID=UPI00226BAE23|nr:hypothetical protein [Citrobacter portucalensis]MCX8985801.1 hypothetical protein [Citrobacter portucalensis]